MKKFIPIILIVFLMIIAYFFGLYDYLDLNFLKTNFLKFKKIVEANFILMAFVFIGIYILVAALSIPGAIYLSMIIGFLFKQPFSTIYVVIGASIGAIIIFIAAKTAFKDILEKKTSLFVKKMKKGFEGNVVSYLLFLRFIPLFPFWVVNIVPAFFNVRVYTYVWTTFIGIIPGSFISTQIGASLETLLVQETFNINEVFTWPLKIALIILGVISLVPVFTKRIKK